VNKLQKAEKLDFSILTWNINSVRLRLPLLQKLIAENQPDIICLQETKCLDDVFPLKALQEAGYPHITIKGQKSYNGVAILSRYPFEEVEKREFCGRDDCRHLSVLIRLGGTRIRIHNLYVPAGGDEPDPDINEKFAHKLAFIEEMRHAISADEGDGTSVLLVGDLNIAPLEHDVWSHKQLLKIVSHTEVETQGLESMRIHCGFVDLMRTMIPPSEKLYTWWSYRARDWQVSNRGRRLDHIWGSPDLVAPLTKLEVLSEVRGWASPSDHVPVIARFIFD